MHTSSNPINPQGLSYETCIHPLEIATALEEIGHTEKNVTNFKHQQTKISLPVFFADIDPNDSVSNIFYITSILHTKVKI